MAQRGLTYDEALTKYVGEFGRGQLAIVVLQSLFFLPNVVFFYLLVFVAVDPIKQRLWECTSTTDAVCMAVYTSDNPRTTVPTGFCDLSPSQWRWVNRDNLASYFNLVCGDRWRVQMLNMCMFIGCLIGAALFGYLNDGYGRKKPLLLATAICIVSVFASVAAPTYWYMAIARVLIGIGGAGQNQCVGLLNAEIAGKSRRGLASITGSLFWAAGEFMLVGLAIALPAWRHLTLLAGGMTVATLFLFLVFPESARWLLSQGRQEEATAVVRKIAAWNGTKMPDIPLVAQAPAGPEGLPLSPRGNLQTDEEDVYIRVVSANSVGKQQQAVHNSDKPKVGLQIESAADTSQQDSFLQQTADVSSSVPPKPGLPPPAVQPMGLFAALRNPRLLKRTVVMVFTWFALYSVSYGVNLGSGSLPGSVYMTFSLVTVAELAALLCTFFIVDKAGRHVIITVGLVLSGSACLACAMTQNNTARAILAVFGKFGSTVGMTVLGTFSCELFATPIRASAMGIFNEAGRLGSIIAPLMLMVGSQVNPDNAVFVPFLSFGIIALLAGLLTLVLPETLGASMPEDIEDMNQLLSLFTAKPWRQGSMATLNFMFKQKAVKAARHSHTAQRQQSNRPKQKLQLPTENRTAENGNEVQKLEVRVECPEVLKSPLMQAPPLLSPRLPQRSQSSQGGGSL